MTASDTSGATIGAQTSATSESQCVEGRSGQHGSESPEIHVDSFSDIAHDFSESARSLFSLDSVLDVSAKAVELAVANIEGCEFAGLFLLDGDAVTTPVSTNSIVPAIDALQQQTVEGPCLDAITHGLIFYSHDLGSDLRWSYFAQQATRAGIRSELAVPLTADSQHVVLNLCAHRPDAFGVLDRAKATMLATLTSLARTVAQSHEDERRRSASFRNALASREGIAEAIGILMEREHISAEQGFDVLRIASQHLNIKLREVARNLVETGEVPDTGTRRSQ
jgi:GAF domain-containing protein